MGEFPREIRALCDEEFRRLIPDDFRGSEAYEAVFAVRLPFDLPIPSGSQFDIHYTRSRDEPPHVRLLVQKICIAAADAITAPYGSGLAALRGESEPDFSQGMSGQTWVFMATSNYVYTESEAAVIRARGARTVGFERCLAAVNLLTETTRLVTGEHDSRRLTKDGLDPSVTWYKVKPSSPALVEPTAMRLHTRQYNPMYLDEDVRDAYIIVRDALDWRLLTEIGPEPHPLVVPRSLALQAKGKMLRGGATEGIVLLQTAAEGLLRGVHRLLMVDDNLPSTEIVERDRVAFKTLLSTTLPTLLGGNWNGPSSAPMQYRHDLYDVRCRIVHAGVEPTWQDLEPALKAYAGLVSFLDERVRKKWRGHPRTLLAWCEPRAGGSLQIPKSAQSVAETLEAEDSPYWLAWDIAGRHVSSGAEISS